MDEPIAWLQSPLHIDPAPGKSDCDRIGPWMRGRTEPVRHRDYLLRRTLPQGRVPTTREGLFVRLDDINVRRHIYHWTSMCLRSRCHIHHLLLLLFARLRVCLALHITVTSNRPKRPRGRPPNLFARSSTSCQADRVRPGSLFEPAAARQNPDWRGLLL